MVRGVNMSRRPGTVTLSRGGNVALSARVARGPAHGVSPLASAIGCLLSRRALSRGKTSWVYPFPTKGDSPKGKGTRLSRPRLQRSPQPPIKQWEWEHIPHTSLCKRRLSAVSWTGAKVLRAGKQCKRTLVWCRSSSLVKCAIRTNTVDKFRSLKKEWGSNRVVIAAVKSSVPAPPTRLFSRGYGEGTTHRNYCKCGHSTWTFREGKVWGVQKNEYIDL